MGEVIAFIFGEQAGLEFLYNFALGPEIQVPLMDSEAPLDYNNFGLDFLDGYSELQNLCEEREVNSFLFQVYNPPQVRTYVMIVAMCLRG